MRPMLATLLEDHTTLRPHDPALIDSGRTISYAELDAMRLGGFLVSPEEIEETMRRIQGITDAQVVAIEIGRATRCVAFVIPVSGAAPREADVVARCAAVMAPFKVPARVWMVDAFPTTPSANGTKIQRGKLREMALGFCAGERAKS